MSTGTVTSYLLWAAMKKLRDADIVKIMREEWNSKLSRLTEEVDAVFKAKVDGKVVHSLISAGLKIRHKESSFLYTVVSVGVNDVILTTPEGTPILLSKDEVEENYEID